MNPRQHLARVMAALMVVASLLGAASPAAATTPAGAAGGSAPAVKSAQLADFGEPFHWLPPLGVESGDPSKFDGSLLDGLIVQICRVEGPACTPVKTITSASATSERLRIGQTAGKDSYYLATWDVSKMKLEPSAFRVTVTIARLQLGAIEVGPAQYKSFGRSWPIKFRVEKNPTIRVRVLHDAGLGASQIANRIRLEFGVCGDDVAQLLANDLDPFDQDEIDQAIAGACQDADIFPTTKVADPATNNALSAFDPETGRMTFSSPTSVLANLKAGDVLVGEPASAAPNGYLRKVTSITKDRKTGVITVETTQARLDETIRNGTLDATGTLDAGDVQSVQTAPGVTLASRATPVRGATLTGVDALDIGNNYEFHESIDVTIDGSASSGGVSGNGTIHITGTMDFNAGYNLGFGIEDCLDSPPFFTCVDRFEAHFGSRINSTLHVTGSFDGHMEKEVVLSTHYFKPIIFFIGPIPVVLVPIVKASAGISGDAHLDFSFDVQAASALDMGAKWTDPDDGGNDWQDVSQWPPTITGDADGDANVTMDLRAYAEADAKLLLYGIAGPGIAGHVGLWGHVQFPGTPLWTIYGIAQGEVNFAVDLGGLLTLAEFHWPLPEISIELAAAENEPPDCSDHRTEPIVIAPGVARYLGPSDKENGSFQGYFECTDPEGDLPTYTAVDNLGHTVDLSAAKWDLPATYTVTVTAADSAGKTASFDLTVEVAEAQPIVEIISASTTVPTGVQYWVTASAYQAFLGSDLRLVINRLPCASIVWDVPGATSVSYGASRIACTAMIVYADPGRHTITATATGPLGRQGQGILDVNVIDAPANAAPTIALGSFKVTSTDGPRDICNDSQGDALYDCAAQQQCVIFLPCPLPVPMEALLWNGAEGDYHGPLTLELSATDRFGNSLTPTWHCLGGGVERLVTANPDGSFSCDPVGSADSNEIRIWADVTDSDGTTIHSEVRRVWMYRRVI